MDEIKRSDAMPMAEEPADHPVARADDAVADQWKGFRHVVVPDVSGVDSDAKLAMS